jgi:tetratricopeptide (TPR) repeat protein
MPERRDNLQGQLQQARGENRGDLQQNRQDFANNRREDWQNFHDDHYGHYGDWYHGGWAGNAGAWWDHMWEDHTAAAVLGVTAWGVNRLGGWYGYSSYENPYYDSGSGGGAAYADYSQPVTMDAQQAADYVAAEATQPSDATLPPGVSQEAVDKFDQARGQFLNNHFDEALKLADEALTKMPKDAVLQEFRALCLFALKRYREAAAVMNAVLAVGPGWDWTTMSGLYGDTATYTEQLRALETYVGKNPKSSDAHFLAAYHYITCGQTDPAINELKRVVALQPKDTVAAQLLQSMSPPAEKPADTPPAATAPAVPPDAAVGVWSASGPKNAMYEMSLTKDGAFTWNYSSGAKKQSVKGVYAIDGNNLAMQPDGGGTMLMELKLNAPDALHADIVGAAKGDPGLEFKRTAK